MLQNLVQVIQEHYIELLIKPYKEIIKVMYLQLIILLKI